MADLNPLLRAARQAAARGDAAGSASLFGEVLAADARNHAALVGRGHALRALGRAAEAAGHYRRAIADQPASGPAWWALANMKTIALAGDDVAMLTASLAGADATGVNRALLLFTLAKARDDAGDAAAAFAAYAAGNAIMAAHRPYPGGDDNALCAQIIAAPVAVSECAAAAGEPVPIFIVGLPRTGSTLVEQILGSHPAIGGGGEFSHLADILVAAAAAAGVSIGQQAAALDDSSAGAIRRAFAAAWADQRGPAPVFIDKQLNNFWLIGQIARCFPGAPIVDVQRHPFDAAYGAFKQVFAQGQDYSYDFAAYAAYHRLYRRLMDHWAAALPGHVHKVWLEELVRGPRPVLDPILAQLGLGWSAEMDAFHRNSRTVHSASSQQVRRALNPATGDAFAHNAPELAAMRALLADAAAAYPHQPLYRSTP